MTDRPVARSLRDYTVREYLFAVSARQPAPSGGAVAALTVAAAAGLVAMTARYSDGPAGADELVDEAEDLLLLASRLADSDAQSYGQVLTAQQKARDAAGRASAIRVALVAATIIPLHIVETGARVASVGARVVADGNAALAGDALTAIVLAEAGAQAAAMLVRINVATGRLSPKFNTDAEGYLADAAAARQSVFS